MTKFLLVGFISVVGLLGILWLHVILTTSTRTDNAVEMFDSFLEPIPGDPQNVFGNNVQRFYIHKRGYDVLVFVQIPFTGAEDLSTLLLNGLLYGPCPECDGQPDCYCYDYYRESVLLSNIKHPWPCGMYPGLRTLWACIRASRDLGIHRRRYKRMRYLYWTLLRNPAHHFYNEWLEVRTRGWPKWSQIPAAKMDNANRECHAMANGKDVSFKTFVSCPQNPAFNRQTRMLANMSLHECLSATRMSENHCYDKMLSSAKDTLKHMPFFGITEYSYMTQVLFEETFQLKIVDKYVHPLHMETFMSFDISREDVETISNLNKYDFLLYDYAQELFLERYDTLVTFRITEL
ncbi:heparan-sulfate 6-O-sulfotransferase 2-like [Haliotis rubra]|uniref:heparan-sulfate 6-O-sulfotransferase 2-like n=1 Tax=Haliotis rubra TaxID=36100 RepID=UPI001EE61545|nr:heparan-sulfate 6-O-sulfotransferase 2-like [Haliotis rubra]